MTFVKTDALKPLQREIITTDDFDTIIDFLQEYYPTGFERPTDIYTRFGKKIEVDYYDMELGEEDVVVIVSRPAVAAALGLTGIVAWLVNTAVMLAVNFAITKLFAPEEQKELEGSSSVYSLNNSQNQAKLGQTIPVPYGSFRMYPSYIEQPYYKYENNEEYLYLLLCIGHGRYRLNKLQIDTLDFTNSPNVHYRLLTQGNFGNIEAAVPGSSYNMRNNLLSSPFNFELKTGDWSDYFDISDGVNKIEFDYMYPNGYFNVGDDGAYYSVTISFKIVFYDAAKSIINEYTTSVNGQTRRVFRRTLEYFVPSNYKYFRVVQTHKGWNDKSADTVIIHRVKEKYPVVDVTNYGDISLLWVRMKATNAISSVGQQQVNAYLTRIDKGNKVDEVIRDIYTNKIYGAGLNDSDMFLQKTTEEVNGAFETPLTIYDAMKQVSKAQKYTVYPVGQDILLKKDEPKTIVTALYNETNMINGSFRIQYAFNDEIEQYDCIEVSYRDITTWSPKEIRYPSYGFNPQRIDLFGVTDVNKANEMSKYLWKQQEFRRKVITFDTDIQGLSLEFLDKIKISHSSLMWGEAGEIDDIKGNTLTVSEMITKDSNITIRNSDGSVSDMLTFTKVSDYDIIVIGLPNWVRSGMSYTVGVAKEFLVASVRPKDENIASIECVEYNKDIYL